MKARRLFSLLLASMLCACASRAPMPTVDRIDLQRFMGDWYVIAHIPVWLEANAYNAVESYQLRDDGRTIDTTFTFNENAFDGPSRIYYPTGFVRRNSGNARWGMQFVWPIKSDYRIVYLSDDYEQTIIGRHKRDYVWVMARSPQISASDYQGLRARVAELGYDISLLRDVPQQHLADQDDSNPDDSNQGGQ